MDVVREDMRRIDVKDEQRVGGALWEQVKEEDSFDYM